MLFENVIERAPSFVLEDGGETARYPVGLLGGVIDAIGELWRIY